MSEKAKMPISDAIAALVSAPKPPTGPTPTPHPSPAPTPPHTDDGMLLPARKP